MNTDQGSQSPGAAWIAKLNVAGVRISMNGPGRYLGSIFIEWLCGPMKKEAIKLKEFNDGLQYVLSPKVHQFMDYLLEMIGHNPPWLTNYWLLRPSPPTSGAAANR